jgi:hypothetical protein
MMPSVSSSPPSISPSSPSLSSAPSPTVGLINDCISKISKSYYCPKGEDIELLRSVRESLSEDQIEQILNGVFSDDGCDKSITERARWLGAILPILTKQKVLESKEQIEGIRSHSAHYSDKKIRSIFLGNLLESIGPLPKPQSKSLYEIFVRLACTNEKYEIGALAIEGCNPFPHLEACCFMTQDQCDRICSKILSNTQPFHDVRCLEAIFEKLQYFSEVMRGKVLEKALATYDAYADKEGAPRESRSLISPIYLMRQIFTRGKTARLTIDYGIPASELKKWFRFSTLLESTGIFEFRYKNRAKNWNCEECESQYYENLKTAREGVDEAISSSNSNAHSSRDSLAQWRFGLM